MYLNARSLISNAKRLAFEFEIIRHFSFPDIVVVTETWLSDSIPSSLFHCNKYYDIYRFDRDGTGGGVAVFVKNCLQSYEIRVPNIDGLEAVLIAITSGKQKLFVGAVYKPSVTDTYLLDPLKRFVQYISSKRGRHLIVGDFNLPDVDWNNLSAPNHGKQRQFMNVFCKKNIHEFQAMCRRIDQGSQYFRSCFCY